MLKRGCKFVVEGSNMGVDVGGIDVFEKLRMEKGKVGGCWYGLGKVVNVGGVVIFGLEMV